jgi:hypothetical protein
MNSMFKYFFGFSEEEIPDNLKPHDKCEYIKKRIIRIKNERNFLLIVFFSDSGFCTLI